MIKLLRVVVRTLTELIREFPLLIILYTLLDVLHAIVTVFVVVAEQSFFDAIMLLKTGSVKTVINFLIIFLTAKISYILINGLDNYHIEQLSPQIKRWFEKKLFDKVNCLSLKQFDDDSVLKKINKAKAGIDAGLLSVLLFMMFITFYLPYMLFMTVYLARCSMGLLFVMLLAFVPEIWGKVKNFIWRVSDNNELAGVVRRKDFLEKSICDKSFYKETRMLGIFEFLFLKYKNNLNIIADRKFKTTKRIIRHESVDEIINIFSLAGVIVILCVELINKNISIGMFSAVLLAVNSIRDLLQEAFSGVFNIVFENAPNLVAYYEFIDTDIDDTSTSKQQIYNCNLVKLNHVCFRYQGKEEDAIKDFSLKLKKGEIIAIVGDNGAGKSTLSKLLLGLHKPDSGNIEYIDECGKIFSGEDGRVVSTALFQNFNRYHGSYMDNVCISDLCVKDKDSRFDLSVKTAGIDFIKNKNVILGTEYGGIDISGGQWQKIAFARALYRQSDLIILDEPTAAIDPLEETSLYNNFKSAMSDKIGVIITHRIGAARIADRIIVMKNGRIVEEGRHSELIRKDTYYSKLYREQAKWYNDEAI